MRVFICRMCHLHYIYIAVFYVYAPYFRKDKGPNEKQTHFFQNTTPGTQMACTLNTCIRMYNSNSATKHSHVQGEKHCLFTYRITGKSVEVNFTLFNPEIPTFFIV